MGAKFQAESFKKLSFTEMADFIETEYPEDKAWFKRVCFENKDGEKVAKYNHLNAKLRFCEKYAPELIPQAKPKMSVTKRLENW